MNILFGPKKIEVNNLENEYSEYFNFINNYINDNISIDINKIDKQTDINIKSIRNRMYKYYYNTYNLTNYPEFIDNSYREKLNNDYHKYRFNFSFLRLIQNIIITYINNKKNKSIITKGFEFLKTNFITTLFSEPDFLKNLEPPLIKKISFDFKVRKTAEIDKYINFTDNFFNVKTLANTSNDNINSINYKKLILEAFISQFYINPLKYYLPNFIYTFCFVECSDYILEKDTGNDKFLKILTWCNIKVKNDLNTPYIIKENIENLITYKNFVDNLNQIYKDENDKINIIASIYLQYENAIKLLSLIYKDNIVFKPTLDDIKILKLKDKINNRDLYTYIPLYTELQTISEYSTKQKRYIKCNYVLYFTNFNNNININNIKSINDNNKNIGFIDFMNRQSYIIDNIKESYNNIIKYENNNDNYEYKFYDYSNLNVTDSINNYIEYCTKKNVNNNIQKIKESYNLKILELVEKFNKSILNIRNINTDDNIYYNTIINLVDTFNIFLMQINSCKCFNIENLIPGIKSIYTSLSLKIKLLNNDKLTGPVKYSLIYPLTINYNQLPKPNILKRIYNNLSFSNLLSYALTLISLSNGLMNYITMFISSKMSQFILFIILKIFGGEKWFKDCKAGEYIKNTIKITAPIFFTYYLSSIINPILNKIIITLTPYITKTFAMAFITYMSEYAFFQYFIGYGVVFSQIITPALPFLTTLTALGSTIVAVIPFGYIFLAMTAYGILRAIINTSREKNQRLIYQIEKNNIGNDKIVLTDKDKNDIKSLIEKMKIDFQSVESKIGKDSNNERFLDSSLDSFFIEANPNLLGMTDSKITNGDEPEIKKLINDTKKPISDIKKITKGILELDPDNTEECFDYMKYVFALNGASIYSQFVNNDIEYTNKFISIMHLIKRDIPVMIPQSNNNGKIIKLEKINFEKETPTFNTKINIKKSSLYEIISTSLKKTYYFTVPTRLTSLIDNLLEVNEANDIENPLNGKYENFKQYNDKKSQEIQYYNHKSNEIIFNKNKEIELLNKKFSNNIDNPEYINTKNLIENKYESRLIELNNEHIQKIGILVENENLLKYKNMLESNNKQEIQELITTQKQEVENLKINQENELKSLINNINNVDDGNNLLPTTEYQVEEIENLKFEQGKQLENLINEQGKQLESLKTLQNNNLQKNISYRGYEIFIDNNQKIELTQLENEMEFNIHNLEDQHLLERRQLEAEIKLQTLNSPNNIENIDITNNEQYINLLNKQQSELHDLYNTNANFKETFIKSQENEFNSLNNINGPIEPIIPSEISSNEPQITIREKLLPGQSPSGISLTIPGTSTAVSIPPPVSTAVSTAVSIPPPVSTAVSTAGSTEIFSTDNSLSNYDFQANTSGFSLSPTSGEIQLNDNLENLNSSSFINNEYNPNLPEEYTIKSNSTNIDQNIYDNVNYEINSDEVQNLLDKNKNQNYDKSYSEILGDNLYQIYLVFFAMFSGISNYIYYLWEIIKSIYTSITNITLSNCTDGAYNIISTVSVKIATYFIGTTILTIFTNICIFFASIMFLIACYFYIIKNDSIGRRVLSKGSQIKNIKFINFIKFLTGDQEIESFNIYTNIPKVLFKTCINIFHKIIQGILKLKTINLTKISLSSITKYIYEGFYKNIMNNFFKYVGNAVNNNFVVIKYSQVKKIKEQVREKPEPGNDGKQKQPEPENGKSGSDGSANPEPGSGKSENDKLGNDKPEKPEQEKSNNIIDNSNNNKKEYPGYNNIININTGRYTKNDNIIIINDDIKLDTKKINNYLIFNINKNEFKVINKNEFKVIDNNISLKYNNIQFFISVYINNNIEDKKFWCLFMKYKKNTYFIKKIFNYEELEEKYGNNINMSLYKNENNIEDTINYSFNICNNDIELYIPINNNKNFTIKVFYKDIIYFINGVDKISNIYFNITYDTYLPLSKIYFTKIEGKDYYRAYLIIFKKDEKGQYVYNYLYKFVNKNFIDFINNKLNLGLLLDKNYFTVKLFNLSQFIFINHNNTKFITLNVFITNNENKIIIPLTYNMYDTLFNEYNVDINDNNILNIISSMSDNNNSNQIIDDDNNDGNNMNNTITANNIYFVDNKNDIYKNYIEFTQKKFNNNEIIIIDPSDYDGNFNQINDNEIEICDIRINNQKIYKQLYIIIGYNNNPENNEYNDIKFDDIENNKYIYIVYNKSDDINNVYYFHKSNDIIDNDFYQRLKQELELLVNDYDFNFLNFKNREIYKFKNNNYINEIKINEQNIVIMGENIQCTNFNLQSHHEFIVKINSIARYIDYSKIVYENNFVIKFGYVEKVEIVEEDENPVINKIYYKDIIIIKDFYSNNFFTYKIIDNDNINSFLDNINNYNTFIMNNEILIFKADVKSEKLDNRNNIIISNIKNVNNSNSNEEVKFNNDYNPEIRFSFDNIRIKYSYKNNEDNLILPQDIYYLYNSYLENIVNGLNNLQLEDNVNLDINNKKIDILKNNYNSMLTDDISSIINKFKDRLINDNDIIGILNNVLESIDKIYRYETQDNKTLNKNVNIICEYILNRIKNEHIYKSDYIENIKEFYKNNPDKSNIMEEIFSKYAEYQFILIVKFEIIIEKYCDNKNNNEQNIVLE